MAKEAMRTARRKDKRNTNKTCGNGSVEDPGYHCAINLLDSEYMIDINVAEALDNVREFINEEFEVALDAGAGEHVAASKDAPPTTL